MPLPFSRDDPNDSNLLQWLFFDLNSYFASVEQQENPALRGVPIAVLPVMTDTTCCIAASYEAKAFGIKTGTPVWEAKGLCPTLRLVEARQDLYVAYHKRIVETVESCIPVDHVSSIDEMICRLSGSQRRAARAVELAQHLKRTMSEKVGPYLRSSIGLATNRFLAKVASDMQKPDGLTILFEKDLPQKLFSLSLRELPGIGEHMESRLHEAGIETTRQLCELSSDEMRRLWGGVWGERLWSWLRGKDTAPAATHRHSIGHSHVLDPASRNAVGLFQVAKRLTGKAAVRLREEDFWASGLTLGLRFMDKTSWEGKARFAETQDTSRLLKVLNDLWKDVPPQKPLFVAVTLHPLMPGSCHTPSLFDNPKQEKISSVMDAINEKYGRDTAYFASLQDSLTQAPTRIAFSRIPDLSEF